jgi:hypothetical protein
LILGYTHNYRVEVIGEAVLWQLRIVPVVSQAADRLNV